jgi:hypothetical protein
LVLPFLKPTHPKDFVLIKPLVLPFLKPTHPPIPPKKWLKDLFHIYYIDTTNITEDLDARVFAVAVVLGSDRFEHLQFLGVLDFPLLAFAVEPFGHAQLETRRDPTLLDDLLARGRARGQAWSHGRARTGEACVDVMQVGRQTEEEIQRGIENAGKRWRHQAVVHHKLELAKVIGNIATRWKLIPGDDTRLEEVMDTAVQEVLRWPSFVQEQARIGGMVLRGSQEYRWVTIGRGAQQEMEEWLQHLGAGTPCVSPFQLQWNQHQLVLSHGELQWEAEVSNGGHMEGREKREWLQLSLNMARGSQVSVEGPAEEAEGRRVWYRPQWPQAHQAVTSL